MSILLKCSSRKHTLRLNPAQYWKTTLCPVCKTAVDPVRLRRIIKLPSILTTKDINIVPAFFKTTIIPILGLLALVVGVSLTYWNWRKTPAAMEQDISSSGNSNIDARQATPPGVSNTLTNIVNSIDPISVPSPTGSQSNSSSPPTANVNILKPPDELIAQSQNAIASAAPTATPVEFETGTNLIRPQNVGGRARLQISNGTAFDAVAKLVDVSTNKTARLVYIRAATEGTISQIRSGKYILKFSLGSGYDKDSGKFTDNQSFSKFDEIMDFQEYREGRRTSWSDGKVTLNPVVGGKAKTSSISADDFEDH